MERSQFKLLFILEGRIEHELEGMDGRRILGPGDILACPAGRNHVYMNVAGGKAASVHLVRLFLDADYLAKRARRRVRKPEVELGDFVLHHFPQPRQLEGGVDNRITTLLAELRREAETKAVGFRHRARSICTDLIVAVARKMGGGTGEGGEVEKAGASPLVSGAKEYILKHLGRDFTLSEVAWQVGKGEEHLARVFKRETGKSVFDYVREARVERAKTHLLDPAETLTVIAERCGFNSLSFFSRTFRQLTGMTPSGYRKHTHAVMRPQFGVSSGYGLRKRG